ncbi:MurR/RpiR family transcriptional regulator, partial [Bradyrhizobium sp. BRP14]|nr:MurR/RpiR family transcriptional regulator [Bradyrhizobium sp. BRP14]
MEMSEGTRPPTNVTGLKGLIASRALKLPKQLEQVARLALARPDVVAFGSARSIAVACSVSPTTVARLATALGFDSFRDFKLFFQHGVMGSSSSRRQLRSAPSLKEETDHGVFCRLGHLDGRDAR